eukprot:g40242.t1
MILGMNGLSYEQRLRTLGLNLLEFRRMRGDVIETYRILRGLRRLDVKKILSAIGEVMIRRHSLRVKRQLFRTEMRKNFSQVFNLWKPLLQKAVEARSLTEFKTDIDSFLMIEEIKSSEKKAGELGLAILSHFYIVKGNRKEAARIAAEFYGATQGQ